MQNDTRSHKRPVVITIFCILGFIGGPFVTLGLLIPSAREQLTQQYGVSFIPITILLTLTGLTGLIGYWKMRKWGVYVYTAMGVTGILYGLVANIQSGILGYLVPIVIIIIGFVNLKKMQ